MKVLTDAFSWLTFRWTHPVPPQKPFSSSSSLRRGVMIRVSLEGSPDTCCSVGLASWTCVCVCVWGRWEVKEDLLVIMGSKEDVIITALSYGCGSVSCILLCLQALAPWPCFLTEKRFLFQLWSIVKISFVCVCVCLCVCVCVFVCPGLLTISLLQSA